jgi:hypothetical protein
MNRSRIETLETQNSDRLDFHGIAVWRLRQALGEGRTPPA